MRKTSTYRLTLNALFLALVLLLGMTPLGLIPLGFINLTILHIPVIIGTIVLGLKSGMLLGCAFGLCSTLSMIGISGASQSALAYALFERSPLLAVLMCMIPRLCVPFITHIVYTAIPKEGKMKIAAVPAAAVCGSLTNTVLYLGLMYWFYQKSGLDVAELSSRLGFPGLTFIGVLGGVALGGGGCEALAAMLISPPVVKALNKIKKG